MANEWHTEEDSNHYVIRRWLDDPPFRAVIKSQRGAQHVIGQIEPLDKPDNPLWRKRLPYSKGFEHDRAQIEAMKELLIKQLGEHQEMRKP